MSVKELSEHRPGLLVSIEGISGVGKSYLSKRLMLQLSSYRPLLVPELSNRIGNGLDCKILSVLKDAGDQFFRLGLPTTETFLLIALKALDYELWIAPALQRGQLVIEDRSLDTIAVYQAVMMAPNDFIDQQSLVSTIYKTAAQWRRVPDITFLLSDTVTRSIARAEERAKRRYTQEELTILHAADSLYRLSISPQVNRVVSVDRATLNEDEVVELMFKTITTTL